MSKFLIGILTGLLLAGLLVVAVVLTAVSIPQRRPTVADESVLILQLEGEIPERAPVEIPIPFFEQRKPLTVAEARDVLRKAAVDSRIRAVVLVPGQMAIGWGKLQELRDCLMRYRESGKPLVAFLHTPGTREYYLATAADRIYLPPEDYLNLKGLRAEATFFQATLEKVGVEVETERAGKYKNYMDTFTQNSMSPETREVLDSVLDELYGHLVETIASSRGKTVEEVRGKIDEGPFLSREALSEGLVDALSYEDEVFQELEERLGVEELHKLSHRQYVRVPANSLGLEGDHRIALLVAQGEIVRGGGAEDWLSGSGGIRSGEFTRLLRRVGDDRRIEAIVVRIDSPGGDAFASDEIWREMNLLSKKKPLVMSMSDTAASGGYYIALTGDPIVAYPGTYTGSVGVFFGKLNLRGLYEKLGIRKEVLKRGRNADMDSDYRPLSAAARGKLREGVEENYRAFVSRVAEARNREFEEVEPLAQGRVWLGTQAQRNGLIDELGGLDRAIELAKEKANIPAEEEVRLVTYPPTRSIMDRLFSRASDSSLDPRVSKLLTSLQAGVWAKGGFLRIMPYTLQVQ